MSRLSLDVVHLSSDVSPSARSSSRVGPAFWLKSECEPQSTELSAGRRDSSRSGGA